jgi:hypothetical protein
LWCWASPIPPSAAINKGVSGVRFPTVLNSARKHWPGFLDRALRHLQQLAMNETYFDSEIIETTLLTKEKPSLQWSEFLKIPGPNTERYKKLCVSCYQPALSDVYIFMSTDTRDWSCMKPLGKLVVGISPRAGRERLTDLQLLETPESVD